MSSLNKCHLIGNLVRDPETRFLANGDAVTNITLAMNEVWKDKNGDKQEKAEFINVVFFKQLAKIVGEHLTKGRSIYVEGKIKTEKYTDKQGVEKYMTKIVANEMRMLGGKQSISEDREEVTSNKPATKTGTGFDDMDDDIPF